MAEAHGPLQGIRPSNEPEQPPCLASVQALKTPGRSLKLRQWLLVQLVMHGGEPPPVGPVVEEEPRLLDGHLEAAK
ncbi:hypothetical protein CRG98_017162 [Punica granatum]|uniref:Uncharacterized protein n=1 Tax=Punica granatum TaxID=22663 RepID=A0A2I0K3S5_PUNGR|nr:hypothetical protein CRG98_017162 [Punica granatum]